MTVEGAINEIRRVGSIRAENGKLRIRFPEPERARLEPAIEALRRNRPAVLEAIRGAVVIPPIERWPEPLRELADERAAASTEPEAVRREVWLSWAEWKARELNRLFEEQGTSRQPSQITGATVQHGERNLRNLQNFVDRRPRIT